MLLRKRLKAKYFHGVFPPYHFINCNLILWISNHFLLFFRLQVEKWGEALVLIVAFFIYIIIGSVVIASYEPEMDFFGAIYFNFVSLTTIGLGDLVPKK